MIFALLLAAQTIGVLEFHDQLAPADQLDAQYLSDRVRSLVKDEMPELRVITRENMLVILQAQGKSIEDCEGECEVDTARRIGADLIVSGELLKFGADYKLNMKLHEVKSGELLSGEVASGEDAQKLERALRPAVTRLLKPLHPQAQPQRIEAPPPEQPSKVSALEMLNLGVGHTFAGHFSIDIGLGSTPVDAESAVPNSDRSKGIAMGFGADLGVHLGDTISLVAWGNFEGVLPYGFFLAGGGAIRAAVSKAVQIDLGGGYGRTSSATSGVAIRGGVDVAVFGPAFARLQLLYIAQSTGNGLFESEYGLTGTVGMALSY